MHVTIRRRGIITAAALAAAFLLPASAGAETINVHPGRGAIQAAINGASNGDTLRIHAGRYRDAPTVRRRLTLVGVGGRPVIDAACKTDIALGIRRAGVKVEHLKVEGAAEGPGPGYTINLFGIDTGTVEDVVVKDTCGGGNAPEYGINVFGSGELKILDNHTYGGFTDAGIYVGGISDTLGGSLRVEGNESNGNNRGIIIEDSFEPTVDMQVIGNYTHDNTIGGEGTPSGIFVHNSDEGTYSGNTADDNGDYGIHIDSPSGDNVFTGNDAQGNGTFDLFNEGSGNCSGGGNSFGTTSGNALGTC